MTPTIETIVEHLVAGIITNQQAITLLYKHASGAANELRDHFAAQALIGWRDAEGTTFSQDAEAAYKMADEMMRARKTT